MNKHNCSNIYLIFANFNTNKYSSLLAHANSSPLNNINVISKYRN